MEHLLDIILTVLETHLTYIVAVVANLHMIKDWTIGLGGVLRSLIASCKYVNIIILWFVSYHTMTYAYFFVHIHTRNHHFQPLTTIEVLNDRKAALITHFIVLHCLLT